MSVTKSYWLSINAEIYRNNHVQICFLSFKWIFFYNLFILSMNSRLSRCFNSSLPLYFRVAILSRPKKNTQILEE